MILWFGIEQEGTHYGVKTLFIASPRLRYDQIINAVNKYSPQQLYFGAGLCSKINYETLLYFRTRYPTLTITMEVEVKESYKIPEAVVELIKKRSVFIIITTTNIGYSLLTELPIDVVQVKVQSLIPKKVVGLVPATSIQYADAHTLEGKKYASDEVIL